jgi:hypothetical protein
MIADVPGSFAPAHGGGVQGGQQRRPRFAGRRHLLIARQHDPGRAVEIDLRDVQLTERLLDLRGLRRASGLRSSVSSPASSGDHHNSSLFRWACIKRAGWKD